MSIDYTYYAKETLRDRQISKEVDEGIIIDFTKDNKIMAIEILDASQRIPKEKIKEAAVDAY
ncbi:DUF2283 domain-containing protein [Candidatus Woesearchaeota archaeon]|nr:DUF2283 domain-containing protein [Candidatus Woesearchaeota archaeon]